VGNSCWFSLSHGEWVPTNKVRAFYIWIIQGVEEIGGGGGEKILDMLLQRIYLLSSRRIGNKAVIINGVDVWLLGDHESKASACRVFEGDAESLVAKDALNVSAVVEFVVESGGDFYLACGITILDDDDVVVLEEWTPVVVVVGRRR